MSPKLRYFLSSAFRYFQSSRLLCPACKSANAKIVDRKFYVTALRKCTNCELLFRTPTHTPQEDAVFYQRSYQSGLTTQMPSPADLRNMTEKGFLGTTKDYSSYLSILKNIECSPGERLLDFGASWGYGTWQFMQAGFDTVGFEVSRERAEYGARELECQINTSLDKFAENEFDIFFSSHVLEHVPNLMETIDFGFRVLRPGGLFVAITPNGSVARRSQDPRGWHQSWGLVHPNFLSAEFWTKTAKAQSFFLTSIPYSADELVSWSQNRSQSLTADCSGGDLLFVGVKS